MNKAHYAIALPVLMILIIMGCAKRGNPEGGPEDLEPPQYVRANPENFTTNFDSDEIRIVFDEYVKLNEAQRQIIISPPMNPRPEITPLGTADQSVRINISDTLQENTTYTINFGRSIVDNNEANPLNFFQYIFSTGDYIDSLSVSGVISDAYLKEPDPFISVMLYEVDSTYSDSAIYTQEPRYITNTLDSATTFQLNYLEEGTYQLVALQDLNSNYRYDPETEKIAFVDHLIEVPTDSVYELNLFTEVPDFAVLRPKQVAQQHIIFPYVGAVTEKDSLNIDLFDPPSEEFESRITKDRETDTLHYWYRPIIERDSLHFQVESNSFRDTLIVRMQEIELDSLEFSFNPSGTVIFEEEVQILPNIPLVESNDSLINIVNKDTVDVPFDLQYDAFENELSLQFEKEENQVYSFTALPGAFTDFFGRTNDTLRQQFRTQAISDYGSVTLNLNNIEQYPIIVQLTNEDGEILAEEYATSGNTFTFRNLKPDAYFLRVVYDENFNRKWDSGNFLNKQQPEEIIYYPVALDIRANWDEVEIFTLQ